MNYYERHIGDYLKDTAHLSLLEHGVYTRLLDVYYTREDGIPDDQAARLIGARSKDEREALKAVLAEYFELAAGMHTQTRSDREIARYQDKQRKAKAAADARWSESGRNANAFPSADAPMMRTHMQDDPKRNATRAPSQSPVTSNQTPKEKRERSPRGSRLPVDWVCSEEWQAYCREKRPELNPSAVACNFADYWHGKAGIGATKADWFATWRTWVRKEDAPKPLTKPPPESFRQQDAREAAAKVAFLTGRKPNATPPPQGDFIEAEVTDVTPRALG